MEQLATGLNIDREALQSELDLIDDAVKQMRDEMDGLSAEDAAFRLREAHDARKALYDALSGYRGNYDPEQDPKKKVSLPASALSAHACESLLMLQQEGTGETKGGKQQRACAGCGQPTPKQRYSKNQWSKGPGQSSCQVLSHTTARLG
jgi:hypothetical protein